VEVWQEIYDFPGYAVSNLGRVKNLKTDRILALVRNQQGIAMAGLVRDRVQHRRSVSVLVANEFLEPHRRDDFDTPINIDGDRTNNAVTNLAWRPRWFAVKYHAQWRHPSTYKQETQWECIDTGEKFANSREVCRYFGLIEDTLWESSINNWTVFPTGYRFRYWLEK